jgi:3-deoxy-7-phosphoheptulonate synthase
MREIRDDLRILRMRPLVTPVALLERVQLSSRGSAVVATARHEIGEILANRDPRLLVIVGPCSLHDISATLQYAEQLALLARELRDSLLLVMRAYLDKPRTTVGWKGFAYDPTLDGRGDINRGLWLSRTALRDIAELGLPTATEFVDPMLPQYVGDLVAWAAIGARTSESQTHRQLASGLSMPVGFKNRTDGNVRTAIDAMLAAAAPHQFLGVTKYGMAAIIESSGHDATHLVLRGGSSGPNYDAASVRATTAALRSVGLPERVMIDCSHGNCDKDHRKQVGVAVEVAARVANGDRAILGLMLESFLEGGRQPLTDPRKLRYGLSVTDACMDWPATEVLIRKLATASEQRRRARPATSTASTQSREAKL